MDWDWKELAWDGVELDLLENTSGGQNKGGVSVDLKIGEVSDSGSSSAEGKVKEPKDPNKRVPPFSRLVEGSEDKSSKRTRTLGGSQSMSCLVDGCNSDLTNCKGYHRRHRVCEEHSKAPVVSVGGNQQRFCQQCSRFHSLGEFDEGKRSCRKRLDGHNRRRRKPQPASFFMAPEKFLSNYKGPRILQFDNPHMYAAPALGAMPPVIGKHQVEHANYPKPDYDDQVPPGISFCQSHTSRESGKSNGKLLTNGMTRLNDSGRALYLLSSLPKQTSGLSFVQSQVRSPAQPLHTELHLNALNKYSCSNGANDKPRGPVLLVESNATTTHQNGLHHSNSDGLVDHGCSLTPPSLWD